MRILLDTDVCIHLIRSRSDALLRRLEQYEVGEVGISSVTAGELFYGVACSRHVERNERALQQFLAPLVVAPFDLRAAAAYGPLRARLERAGRKIGPLDTLIAAHATALDATLVTHNVREFERVRGLRVEHWRD